MASVSTAQYIGARAGLHFNQVDADLYVGQINDAPQSITSPLLGIVSEFELSPVFSIMPELHYTQKGFAVDAGRSLDLLGLSIPVEAKATTRVKYIELPVLAKARFGNDKIKGYATAGAAIGRAFDAYLRPQLSAIIDINLPRVPIDFGSSNLNRIEFSGIVGAGLEVPDTKGKFFADVRYQHSFTNTINDPVIDVSVRNKGVHLSVGYMARL